tara:strand:+ start:422 stop:580 length:159 start_codon:yes stop_codon:yes gene_type:complete
VLKYYELIAISGVLPWGRIPPFAENIFYLKFLSGSELACTILKSESVKVLSA